MGKTSSNAGIHPYLKPDFKFTNIVETGSGLPLSTQTLKFVDSPINTEYKDKNKKDLYFKDEVQYENSNYQINYDSKNFKWAIVRGKTMIALKEVHKQVVLIKKCQAR